MFCVYCDLHFLAILTGYALLLFPHCDNQAYFKLGYVSHLKAVIKLSYYVNISPQLVMDTECWEPGGTSTTLGIYA